MSSRNLTINDKVWIDEEEIMQESVHVNTDCTFPADQMRLFNGKIPINWVKTETKKDDLEKLRSIIGRSLMEGSYISVDQCRNYLCLVGELWKETCLSEWKSYGHTIGLKDSEVSLKDLYAAKDSLPVDTTGQAATSTMDEDDDIWISFYLTSIWRLNRNSRAEPTYLEELCQRGESEGQKLIPSSKLTEGTSGPRLRDLMVAITTWGTHVELSKLMGGIDMYLHRFPTNKFSIIRFGTVVSRHKDCMAIVSIAEMTTLLGLSKASQLLDWMYVPAMKVELLRLAKKGQEAEDPDGYFPYLMDMMQIRKSPYSSSINPVVFTFLHMIGSLSLHPRSQNAQMHFNIPITNVIFNAICVVWGFRGITNFEKIVTIGSSSEASKIPFKRDDDENQLRSQGPAHLPPTTSNGSEFFLWLRGNDFSLPDEVFTLMQSRIPSMKGNREGKIGPYLKSILPSFKA